MNEIRRREGVSRTFASEVRVSHATQLGVHQREQQIEGLSGLHAVLRLY
jgi:hypothetical protein